MEKLDFTFYPVNKIRKRSREFLALAKRRRSVRTFSEYPVPIEIIENCIAAAGYAPSGANRQPWHFVAVSQPEIKRHIRQAAEDVEQSFYNDRAGEAWLKALKPLATDAQKPFLEEAPWLIAVFAERFHIQTNTETEKNYYVSESVGIATGILVTALNYCGLATLTYTPSPMKFLSKILKRPGNEKPFLLLVTGYPAEKTLVPKIGKKDLNEILTVIA